MATMEPLVSVVPSTEGISSSSSSDAPSLPTLRNYPYPHTAYPSFSLSVSPSSSSSSTTPSLPYSSEGTRILTNEEINLYETNGCLLVCNVFTAEELEQIRDYATEIHQWPRKDILHEPNAYTHHSETILLTVPGNPNPSSSTDNTLIHTTTGSASTLSDGSTSSSSSSSPGSTVTRQRVICRVENFIPFHDKLATLIQRRVQPLVSQLFQEEAVLFKEKINYKLPGGGGYAPHYDGPSAAALDLATTFITAQIAIDDQTEENGCLYGVLPKASWVPPVMQEVDKDGDPDITGRAGAIPPDIASTFIWRPLIAPAGSVLLFDHYFPHRSPPNRSNSIRRTGYFIYNVESEGDHHELYYYLMSEARRKYATENLNSSRSSVVSDHSLM